MASCHSPRVAVGVAERLELLEMGELPHVDLCGEVPADRAARASRPARGSRPGATRRRRTGPSPAARAAPGACPPRTWKTTASVTWAGVFAREAETLVDSVIVIDSEAKTSRGLSVKRRQQPNTCDLVIVGGGVAGLYAALCVAREARVTCFEGAAALVGQLPGAGRCRRSDRRGRRSCLARRGHDPTRAGASAGRVRSPPSLPRRPRGSPTSSDLGVEFDAELGLEGGHSRARVVHAEGAETGRRSPRVLRSACSSHPRISVGEGERCRGPLDARTAVASASARRTDSIAAHATLLATGGAAALWERTTNPLGAIGDGIAMAYRAGAAVADLEFVQFHPTALVGSRLSPERGAARSGRAARRRRGAPLHRRARAARRRRPGDRRARHCAARSARDRPRPLPDS